MKTAVLLLALFAGIATSHHGPFHPLAPYLHPELYGQYHKGLRPNHGTEVPTGVKTKLYIRRFSKIYQETDIFGLDFTLHQTWNDPRLRHNNEPYVTLTSRDAWERLWIADTFFRNSITEKTFDLPSPNQYAKVSPNGDILTSQRLNAEFACPGINQQIANNDGIVECKVQIASYAWTKDDLIYQWVERDPVGLVPNLTSMPQAGGFSLLAYKSAYCDVRTNTGEYSCLQVVFKFKKN